METKEMIYTAVFQNGQGKLFTSRYTGVISRSEAWLSAAQMGGSDGNCLLALIPGDHPVYFYEDFVTATSSKPRSEQQNHDLFLLD